MVCSAPGKHRVWTCSAVRCRLLGVSRSVNETRARLIQWQQEQWKANCISRRVSFWPPSCCLSSFIASSCFPCTPKAPGSRQPSESRSITWHVDQPGHHFSRTASLNQPGRIWVLQILVRFTETPKGLGLPIQTVFISNMENQRILPRPYSSPVRRWLESP